MTTKVTITNSSSPEDGHDVEISALGSTFKLKPGDSWEGHVWAAGGEIGIKEALDPEAHVIHPTPELERTDAPKRKRAPRKPPKLERE